MAAYRRTQRSSRPTLIQMTLVNSGNGFAIDDCTVIIVLVIIIFIIVRAFEQLMF